MEDNKLLQEIEKVLGEETIWQRRESEPVVVQRLYSLQCEVSVKFSDWKDKERHSRIEKAPTTSGKLYWVEYPTEKWFEHFITHIYKQ